MASPPPPRIIDYGNVLQTGVQSLLALAAGWACARWRVLDAEPAVAQLNQFVLRVCIPALQLWLLAVKTDMRRPENWRVLGAFLAWSIGLQALCAARQLLTRRRGPLDAARLAVDSLVLTTNNTGILGPVVLEAALGPDYAPLGMLATVALYFQQLPSAAVLFDMHTRQQQQQHGGGGGGVPLASLQPSGGAEEAPLLAAAGTSKGGAGGLNGHDPEWGAGEAANGTTAAAAVEEGPAAAAAAHPRRPGWSQQQHQQQQQHSPRMSPRRGGGGVGSAGGGKGAPLPDSGPFGAALLMAQNPMVLSTAAALLLSCLGSAVLLDPSSPARLRPLGFVEPLLRWFAGCTAPVTLFCTGLWAEGRGAVGGAARRELVTYLALRATLAPAAMAALARLFGFRGAPAVALVILSVLPVAQTAFVICKQYEVGTHMVTAAMVASLLQMLPQLMVTLALVDWSGLFL